MNSQEFERKLTAILSADAVGYSRLMGEDEDFTVRTLTGHREMISTLIRNHKGRVVDSPGDNLLAVFSSVTRAVDCAVEIQREMSERNEEWPENRRLEYRIGINLGDVIEDGERIYGDGINIAARLESLAKPGGICISGVVYSQVKNRLKLEYEYQGKRTVKNIREPVPVYRILSLPITTVRASVQEDLSSSLPDKPSIVVLPFVNISGDPEQEYFSDGMTEEIIGALARLEGLKVISRTSAFFFKGKDVNLRTIGQELKVEHVLEGSVRKSGKRLRISVQLIKVSDDTHLWSERYDRQLEDVFAIQDEIALAIVENLKVTLLHHERAAIVRRQTENVEAHKEYLRALHYWNSFTPEGFARSHECITRAIEIDPQFAAAYSLAAGWHLSQTYWGDVSPRESVAVARSMVEKALTLDSADSEAYGTLGLIRGMFEADGEAGERLMKKEVSLAPGDALMQLSLGLFLSMRGHHQEAVEYIQRARQLDPLSPNVNAWSASSLVECGLVDEGVGELEKLIALMPEHWLAHYELARAYHSQSRLEEARVMGEKAVELSAGMSVVLSRLACIYYTMSDSARGDETMSRLQKRSEEHYVAPAFLAWVHMARGEQDQAVGWLERARQAKDPWFCATRVYTQPFFVPNSPVDTFLTQAGW